MSELNTLQSLLSQVMVIEARHRSQAQVTGEQFNIFRILGLESAEVRTHSAFLAELLSPRGSHGQKELFLNLFVQQIGLPEFDTATATIEIEKHIGFINESSLEGGRIDICIFPKGGYPIFIENKIYTGDQKNQLLRYHNYNSEAKLIYLTLDGSEPGEYTTGSSIPPEAVQALSYATGIISWLEACRKEAAMQPLVRETITQYINLLKGLTGQSTNKMMTDEVKKLILQNKDSVASAQNIRNAFNQIRSEVQTALCEDLINGFRMLIDLPADRLLFTYKGYNVKFKWDKDGSYDFYYGCIVYDQDGKGGVCKRGELDELAADLRAMNSNFKRTTWWLGWITPPGFTKVDNCSAQFLFELSTPEGRQELVAKTMKEAQSYLNQLLQKYGQQPAELLK
ncbi:PDDEXK-like family protein [Hymenobacter cellulosivorans]|uniref:PD-(D/E)XK nuclease family protein n=1 Tax=Hymenobacter cellulosivorans TaxID=2932249 RepID=A0ABY4F4Z5_9BACT|nr:PD-(D/E)XK nuclease family protein [Hymenobacter cellulosivorans]UOQ51744.1 PD-(D/E)XK nuclease family protein [Hymenobacter cellulosivorans]